MSPVYSICEGPNVNMLTVHASHLLHLDGSEVGKPPGRAGWQLREPLAQHLHGEHEASKKIKSFFQYLQHLKQCYSVICSF